METNSITSGATRTTSRAARAITTALGVAAFVIVMAFGAPDDQSSRWDDGVEAHSDVAHEIALDGAISLGD